MINVKKYNNIKKCYKNKHKNKHLLVLKIMFLKVLKVEKKEIIMLLRNKI